MGLELSFKTDAEPERVASAKELVEQRYNMLQAGGKTLGKEKLLAFVALGLADDVIMSNQRLDALQKRAGKLLTKID
jgi:cell division protein ZapA